MTQIRATKPSTPSPTSRAASSSKTATAPDAPGRARERAEILALAREVTERLTNALDQPPYEPGAVLVLDAWYCRQLEDMLGLGTTMSAEALLKAVNRLGTIKIGDIRIPFTPGQLEELQHRAGKRGRTVEMEMRAVVARIEDELFYKGG